MLVRHLLVRKERAARNSLSLKVRRSDSLKHLVAILTKFKVGAVVVVEDTGELCGIVSERDLIKELAERDGSIHGRKVEDIMTKDVTTADSDDDIQSIMEKMTEGHFRHVPVTDEREIKGIISIRDVVEAVLFDLEHENQTLKEYVLGLR